MLLMTILAALFGTGEPTPVPGMDPNWVPYAACALTPQDQGKSKIQGFELWGTEASLHAPDEEIQHGGIVRYMMRTDQKPSFKRDSELLFPTEFSSHGLMIRTAEFRLALMIYSVEKPGQDFTGTYIEELNSYNYDTQEVVTTDTPYDLDCRRYH